MTTNTNIPPNPAPSGQIPNGADPQGQMPTQPQGQIPSDSQQQVPIESLPQVVQDYIKSLRKEAEDARKKLDADARAKQQAEAQRLQEQGQFQQLAEQHATRIKELEPISERFTQLSTLVADQITAETKDWPSELKIFDPGNDAPIELRLEWVKKSRPLIEKLQLQARAQQPGNGPNPRPAPPATRDDAVAGFMNKMRQSGKYGA